MEYLFNTDDAIRTCCGLLGEKIVIELEADPVERWYFNKRILVGLINSVEFRDASVIMLGTIIGKDQCVVTIKKGEQMTFEYSDDAICIPPHKVHIIS